MPANWYTLCSHSNKEDILWQHLLGLDFVDEVYFPRLRVNPVNPRAKKIRPYFPGYLFVYADLEKTGISAFQWMPHSRGLVIFGSEPAMVPDSLIQAIRQRLEVVELAGGEILEGLKPGDAVVIEDGPFAGYEAIFDVRLPGSERVRVLLKMLSDRQLPVELTAGKIRKKRSSS